jgi:hypothetical protein
LRSFVLLLILLLVASAAGVASDKATDSNAKKSGGACFVDLDGDGIDDNARDLDEDGIPDTFGANTDDAPAKAEGMFASSVSIDWNAGGFGGSSVDVKIDEPNSTKFSSIQFSARDLGTCRGGLKASDGLGIGESGGVNAGGGGMVCEGGICHPR